MIDLLDILRLNPSLEGARKWVHGQSKSLSIEYEAQYVDYDRTSPLRCRSVHVHIDYYNIVYIVAETLRRARVEKVIIN